jgi:hypothetical protein
MSVLENIHEANEKKILGFILDLTSSWIPIKLLILHIPALPNLRLAGQEIPKVTTGRVQTLNQECASFNY